ncbi:sensor histidine kinase [Pseudonocardia nematodicida]|uniref:histidine kinase n=1 Tax=Pseudonocardia nematodicida TaxID=1206997 RepID=A0ABV1KJ62_9PSEU
MTRRGPWPPPGLVAADAVAAAAVAAFALIRSPVLTPSIWVAALAIAVVLPFRRVRPGLVLGAELSAGASAVLIGVPGDPVVLAVAFALYPVALHTESVRGSIIAFGVSLAAVVLPGLAVLVVGGLPLATGIREVGAATTGAVTVVVYSAVVLTSVWVLGRLVRGRRADAAALIRMRERQAVTEERLRIARDVHDIVGHSLGLITMKAAVTGHLADRPEESRAALAMIEQVGRDALTDVRTVLADLRSAPDDLPDLAGVDGLVEAAGAAGLRVDYTALVERERVPGGLQASAYRIVQESLTNALRYAEPRRCSVTVAFDDGVLRIDVVNPSTGRRDPALRGQGIIGMTERAALHGGELTATTGADGEFAVVATIPLDARQHDP